MIFRVAKCLQGDVLSFDNFLAEHYSLCKAPLDRVSRCFHALSVVFYSTRNTILPI